MKKVFFILMMAVPVLLSSCKKEDKCQYSESTVTASAAERTYLQNYLSTNNIIAQQHASGVFYNITLAGTGSSPTICSFVTAKYTGSFIPGGAIFDATPAGSAGSNFALGKVIVGWQKAMPLLKSGGKITLYIPPSLAYGNQDLLNQQTGAVIIPANSYLKFEIELVAVE